MTWRGRWDEEIKVYPRLRLCLQGSQGVEIGHSATACINTRLCCHSLTGRHEVRDRGDGQREKIVSVGWHVFVQTQCCSALQCRWCHLHLLPAASKCDARSLQREDGGRDEWEGRGRRQGRWAAKQNCINNMTFLTPSHSLVYSLVTVCGSRHCDSYTYRAVCDMLWWKATEWKEWPFIFWGKLD